MRWQKGRRSSNVEDRRGQSARGMNAGAGILLLRFLPMLLRGKRSRWLIIGVLVLFGAHQLGLINLNGLLSGQVAQGPADSSAAISPEQQQLADFTSVVLADTEDTWRALFAELGGQYQDPTLVLFTGAVSSACGYAQAAMGPFYCPSDQKVYIDLSFYEDLKKRHNAPGDFAQAYVIAHEVGHHVQTLLGISGKVQEQQRRLSKTAGNQLSVRLELQADCFAGLWAHHADRARHILESGDVSEALTAAAAIGDDRLQRQSQGYVTPESFTHGTSEQRIYWFEKGLTSGELNACNTFEVGAL